MTTTPVAGRKPLLEPDDLPPAASGCRPSAIPGNCGKLGSPLVNEVLIPLGRKDLWNTLPPSDDKLFASYVAHPELAALLPGRARRAVRAGDRDQPGRRWPSRPADARAGSRAPDRRGHQLRGRLPGPARGRLHDLA